MLDMISFWIIYGVLMVAWFSYPLYWSFNLVDKWLENITDGDMKNYLQDKIRNPFLNKFGLMEKTNDNGYVRDDGDWNYMFEGHMSFRAVNNRWSAIIVFWLSLLGFILCVIINLCSFNPINEGKNLHTFTVKLSELVVQYSSLPILIFFCLVVSNSFLKKLYKFGKKAKTAIDKLEDK